MTSSSVNIITDSKSALALLHHPSHTSELVGIVHNLCQCFETVVFTWTPSHIGITGNDWADNLAKSGLSSSSHLQLPIPLTDFLRLITSQLFIEWQSIWEQAATGRLLFSAKPTVLPHYEMQPNHLTYNLLTALRARRARLPEYLHMLDDTTDSDCFTCGTTGSVPHYLFDCLDFINERDILKTSIENLDLDFNLITLLGNSTPSRTKQGKVEAAVASFCNTTLGPKTLLNYGVSVARA